MDSSRFDGLIRSLTKSRRSLLGGVLTVAGGWLGVSRTEAKKKRKSKKRKPKAKPNEYGCLEVGDPCSTAEQCCSGICDGSKGKRKCRAHDTETCAQDQPGYCEAGNPYLALCHGGEATCFHTTAGSNVCAVNFFCADCQRDADCTALGYPTGAACAPFGGEYSCGGICASGMACVIPIGAESPETQS